MRKLLGYSIPALSWFGIPERSPKHAAPAGFEGSATLVSTGLTRIQRPKAARTSANRQAHLGPHNPSSRCGENPHTKPTGGHQNKHPVLAAELAGEIDFHLVGEAGLGTREASGRHSQRIRAAECRHPQAAQRLWREAGLGKQPEDASIRFGVVPHAGA